MSRTPMTLSIAMLAAVSLASAHQNPVPLERAATFLSANQLDDLVAPVALYPDPLLTQLLVACTYPLEIVEASQWLQRNPGLTGATLTAAACVCGNLMLWAASSGDAVPRPGGPGMIAR